MRSLLRKRLPTWSNLEQGNRRLYDSSHCEPHFDRVMWRKGLRPEEYKILNVGRARLAALTAGNVPAAVLNGLETVYAVKQGFRVLARAAEVIELSTGGLGASVANLQSKRDVYRTVIQ